MKLSTANQRWLSLFLFTLAFGYFGFDMKVGDLLEKSPWGIHQWRQTDGASMALLFYEEGNALFHPLIHNQLNSDGEAGGEMPLIYYTASKLYGLFGVNDKLIRYLHFILVISGLLAFLWILGNHLRRPLWAVLSILLSISAPTFMYYGANYLPEAGGLGLALLGTAALLRGIQQDSRPWRMIGMILFVLTGWIKISMIIPILAIGTGFILGGLWNKDQRGNASRWLKTIGLTLTFVLSWYIYIGAYNAAHDSTYFATGIRPAWSGAEGHVEAVWNAFQSKWKHVVLPPWLSWSSVFALLTIALFRKSIPTEWKYLSIFSLLGLGAYLLLFFVNLYEHDYYFYPLYLSLLFIHATAFIGLDAALYQLKRPSIFWLSFLLIGFMTYGSIVDVVKRNKRTYHGWFTDLDNREGFNTISSFLDARGVGEDEKVFVAQDFSSNQKLYFLRRKGWTQLSGIYEAEQLDSLIDRGASIAIVPDTSFYSVTFLQYNITDTIGTHEGIGVYRIDYSKWWNPAAGR